MAILGKYKHKLRLSSVVASGISKTMDTRKTDFNRKCANVDFCENGNVAAASCQQALAASKAFDYESALGETKPKVKRTCHGDQGLRQETPPIVLLLIHLVLKRILNVKGVMNL